ncbi:hypothetical protein EON76_02380 [bacterium]|nr:MAG: hypothetical protein EON76_02380 [bacterium]
MKSSLTQLTKEIASDRQLVTAIVVVIVTSVIFSIYVAINLHPSELQVVTHYSAFGTTNFYRDKWFYLVGFIIFGIINALVYGALACKLFLHKGRELAVPFAWLGVLVILVATSIVYQILKVAALS